MESIIVALITGGLSLIGVIITSRSSGKKVTAAVGDCPGCHRYQNRGVDP